MISGRLMTAAQCSTVPDPASSPVPAKSGFDAAARSSFTSSARAYMAVEELGLGRHRIISAILWSSRRLESGACHRSLLRRWSWTWEDCEGVG
jgi:hypothetical protein